MSILQRQFISDNQGIPIGVILPLEEYRLIEPILKRHTEAKSHEMDKIKLIKQALNDDEFMADLHEVMSDFAIVDSEWWESNE
jgi:hypothetical protein